MPKRKPPRSQRKRTARRPLAPPIAAAPVRPVAPPAPVAPPTPVGAAAPAEFARERPVTRFTTRDYTYVRRDIQRIVVLAAAIIIAIIVLSFFLP